MDAAEFWEHLEHRVCREMERLWVCAQAGMWCDGFIAEFVDFDSRPTRIRGRAWIGFGNRDQESWTFELRLPVPVARASEIRWTELLPSEDVTKWLTVDREHRHLVVAPGDAVVDSG